MLTLLLFGCLVVLQSLIVRTASADPRPQPFKLVSNQLEAEFHVEPAKPQASTPITTTEELTIVVDTGDGSEVSTAKIRRTLNPDGTKSDKVTFQATQAKEAVEKAVKSGQSSVRIVIPDMKDEVSRLDITIPKEAAAVLANGGLSLEIYTDNAKLILRNESLTGIEADFYFRVIPIKNETDRSKVEERARVEQVVKEVAGENSVDVVARPMTIETNLSNRTVDIVLPLTGVTLPENEQDRVAFLADLAIFIEHSDGDRQLVKPEVVAYKNGLLGLKFDINKFSTFTILNMEGWAEYVKAQEADSYVAYIHGYPDGTFRPEKGISRAEMAMILHRLDAGQAGEVNTDAKFSDVASNHWSYEAIHYASANEIMLGSPDGSFQPERFMTRAEMATVVNRWTKLQGDAASSFSDTSGTWAEKEIALVREAGLVQGYPDGSFRPEGLVSRAEAVTIINKVLGRGPNDWTTSAWSDVASTHWAFKDIEEASRASESIH